MGSTNLDLGNQSTDPRERTATAHRGEKPARVLVVEDEHLVALDIQLRLERMGHVPTVVYSGEAALEAVAESNFDLALMDIKLKGHLDGIETAERLRAGYDLPIIYLTAYADNPTLDRARATEPYGYVLKPFQERELRAAIEMALQRHDSDRHRLEQQQLQRFLADASARFAATLDYRIVVDGAAELIVPRYADWCSIHLKEMKDIVPAFSYTCPNGGDTAAQIGRIVDAVEQHGRPELVSQIPDAASLIDMLGSTHVEALRDIGAHSLLCVPVRARDQILGSLVLVSGRLRHRFTADDVLFIGDFASRLGTALDNALLYRSAEHAIQMRDDVLAIVSHDLRTPLGTIVLQAESLAPSPDPNVAKLGIGIVRSAQRMNRLIGDLLDASAINAGRLALDLRTQRAANIAREALDMFRSQADARGISLQEELPELPSTVQCDHDRIVQVLSNLLGNALKFTPRGGVVTLRIVHQGHQVHFEVADTGHGIPAEQLPHLFDRFWHGESRQHGAGLGLFIARGIVAAHGSELRVESKQGEGSRFYFDLPEVLS